MANNQYGWTHEEARQHTLVERLFERCSTYAQDQLPCPEQGTDLPRTHWCERCLAATRLIELGDTQSTTTSNAVPDLS